MITYFNLHAPDSERLLADCNSYDNRESLPCPLTTEHLDGSRRIGPLSVEVSHNRFDEMMIWCWVEGRVVHQRLLNEFERQGFTGYRTEPATVRFRDGSLSTDYREFIVTGWAGIAAPQSGIRVKKSCPACHWKKYTGITNYEELIDWSQWTGDDFFMVWPLPHYVLVTDRVAQFLLGSGVKSFRLGGLDDSDQQVGAAGFNVGRLSNFLPKDLAIKYGSPLGLE
ncbi:MAG: hypothetical protein ACLPY1_09935 [Terracidiphilus sp.]